MKNLISILGTD